MEKVKYKPLPDSFTKLGWAHKKVKRIGNFAIYTKKQDHHLNPSYEVFEVLNQEEYEIAGNKIEAKEAVPGNERWGECAFSCMSLEESEKKLQWMIKRSKEKKK